MIINRTRVNDHQVEGFTFHPGAQFVSDEFYNKTLKDNADFKSQVKAKFLLIEVPPAEPAKEGKKAAPPKKTLAETLVDLPEEEAIAIIEHTIDGLDLKEVVKYDKRRPVIEAAEQQMEARATALLDMAPKSLVGNIQNPKHPGDIKMDIVE